MYENKFPEIDELVMVKVNGITETAVHVSLLEYDNIEAMIQLLELSRRRIRSVTKLTRVGRQEVAIVLRVDKTKGYIDLSKRRITPEDIARCTEKYNKSKTVHSIMEHVARITDHPLSDLYRKFAWPLYRKYGHAYDAFEYALIKPDSIFEGIGSDLPPEVKDLLLINIKRRFSSHPIKIRSDIEITCYYEGIDAIKEALSAGIACGTPETLISITLVALTLYMLQ